MSSKTIKNNAAKALCLSVVMATILSSCATVQQVERLNENAYEATTERALAGTNAVRPSSSFNVDGGFYAARTPLDIPAMNATVRLPAEFQKKANLNNPTPTSLADLSSYITKMSGYRVLPSSDLGADASTTLPGIVFDGTLAGLLDHISGSMNVSWKWTGNSVEIFRYETKMFRINALVGTTDVNATLDTASTSSMSKSRQGGGGQSGNEGESGQKTSIASSFDVWEDITNSVKGALSSGGTLTIAPSAGLITVRDTPANLAQVEAQVREFNRVYGRQVQLTVEVYAVERTVSDAKGVDWNIAWQEAAGRYGLSFGSNGAGTITNAAAPSFSGIVNTGPFAGSGAVIRAINSMGRTTLLTSGTVSTHNGQAVPLNVSREQAYLQSYSTTLTSGDAGNSTTTLTPGVVTDGFSMHLTPRILEDNKVMMRYSVDLSSTDAIETFEAPDGNSAIQLPRRSVRNFLQNVSMRSGQTLVLTGFQQGLADDKSSGPFSNKAWALGGNRQVNNLSRTIVIVVTAKVIEN